MIQIPKRFIQAFCLLLVSIIFVGDLALVDWAKKEAVDRPTEIVLIREEPSEIQTDPIPEDIIEEEPFFYISDDERYTIACIIAGEAYNSDMDLKTAVAQTIYIAMKIEGCRLNGVISRYDGYRDRSVIEDRVWQECQEAIAQIFDRGEMAIDEPIEFFYAPQYCTSDWHESLKYVTTIGGCRFFTRK